jgi:D-lactate dehydrogenase
MILVTEALPEDITAFTSAFPEQCMFFEGILTKLEQIMDMDLAKVETLCIRSQGKVTAEIIAALPNLKLIASRSTGFDHIDQRAAKDRSVPICTVPAYGVQTVSEYAFALLLGLSRKIVATTTATRASNFSLDETQGFDLEGKVFGVLGAGKIGQHAIKIAKGFGMHCIAADAFENAEAAASIGYSYVSLDELLKTADVISVHAPLTPETMHILRRETFGKMKKGVVIVNTARGGHIATGDLIEALDAGIVGGVALDVLEREDVARALTEGGWDAVDQLADDAKWFAGQLKNLLARENVLITPHSAFNTIEAVERIRQTSIENIRVFQGGGLQNQI